MAFLIILILLVIGVSRYAAQRYEQSLFEGRNMAAPGGLTGAQIAAEFLKANGAGDVEIVAHEAMVSDYFDPSRRRLFLRKSTREGKDLGAWAVALHEAAHALQCTSDEDSDIDALKWRQSVIRMTRYLPMTAALISGGAMLMRRMTGRVALMLFFGVCALVLLLNLGTVAIEYNANKRLRLWLEERLASRPEALERLEPILAAVATREVGDMLRSASYFFFSALPGSGKLRPR
jgi:uncharacterized protein